MPLPGIRFTSLSGVARKLLAQKKKVLLQCRKCADRKKMQEIIPSCIHNSFQQYQENMERWMVIILSVTPSTAKITTK